MNKLERKEYAKKMIEASKDKEFIKRTMDCQKEFDALESQIEDK